MTSTFDENGVTLDRYSDILARLQALAIEKWGESIDLSEDEWQGHEYAQLALLLSEINEILQDVYDSMSVNDAIGVYLDRLLVLIGMYRNAAAFSTVTLTLTAGAATTVPAGTRYATASEVIFATDTELVFTAAGSDTVTATCTVVGANDAAIAEVTVIKDSVFGITAVTNAVAATPGRLRETDSELKARHTIAVSTSGDSDLASIFEAVSALTGVSSVYIEENDTAIAKNGIPAHTIYVTVIGGDSDAIANAIYGNKTESVSTYGAQTVSVYDETISQSTDIHFDIAANVPIYLTLNITTVAGVFPDDGEDQIRAAYVTHFADKEISEDVIYNALFGPVYGVPGLVVNTLTVGTAPAPVGTSNVTMTALQKAQMTTAQAASGANLVINYT
jgi:uncharacterized phage protein gp47/JayE